MVDREEAADPEDGVLDPDDLDVERREEVEPIGENRYVVSTDGDEDDGDGTEASTDTAPADSHGEGRSPEGPARAGGGSDHVAPAGSPTPLAAVGERYAVDVAARVDGSVADTRIASDSIVETFEDLLLWYAEQVDESTPSEEVIRILLAESALDVSLLD